jgi:cell filamentation protein
MSDTPRGFGRSAREDAAHNRHYYPQTDILRNKANLRSRAALDTFERRSVADAALVRRPMTVLTYAEFKAIHRHLFESVYAWAGEERDYATGRGAAPFCLPEYIASSMEKLLAELRAEAGLVGLQRGRFAERAAYYANEINAVHPFIEGNGRTLREFLRDLAASAGHRLDLSKMSKETWYPASAMGFASGDPEPLRGCIAAALVPSSGRPPPQQR